MQLFHFFHIYSFLAFDEHLASLDPWSVNTLTTKLVKMQNQGQHFLLPHKHNAIINLYRLLYKPVQHSKYNKVWLWSNHSFFGAYFNFCKIFLIFFQSPYQSIIRSSHSLVHPWRFKLQPSCLNLLVCQLAK